MEPSHEEHDRLTRWAMDLTPENKAEVGRIAKDNPGDPDATAAWNAVREAQRAEHRQRIARDKEFTPESHQGARGLWGLRGMLPTWMGGDTINWEEPVKHPSESPEDYALRADETYAMAYDDAVKAGRPIRRMEQDRRELTPFKDIVGLGLNAAEGIPGAVGAIRTTVAGSTGLAEKAMRALVASKYGPEAVSTALNQENRLPRIADEWMAEARGSFPYAGPLLGTAVGMGLPLGRLGKIGGTGVLGSLGRNAALGAGSSAISSASEDVADAMLGRTPDVSEGLGQAGAAAAMSVPLSLFGLAGGKLSNMIRGGSLAGDIQNLYKAGGKTSVTKGFEFPSVVESAIAKNANYPAPEVAQQVREPIIQKVMDDFSKPMAELSQKNLAYQNSPEGKTKIRPVEYANAVYDTANRLADVPGAPTAVLGKLATKVFEPISFKNRTLVSLGDDSAIMGMKPGERIVSAEQAEKLGLHLDLSMPSFGPRHVDPTIVTMPEAGAPMDKSRLRVILRPREMNARQLHDTKRYAEEAASVAQTERRSASAEDMHPILKGLLESRDRFPYNEHAPESLTATLKNGKTVKGWSAINQLESQKIEEFKTRLKALGVGNPSQAVQTSEIRAPITKAITGFRRGNPDRDAVLEAVLANTPTGTQDLYAAPVARRAAKMKEAASILGNVPWAGSSALNMKPFFRAVGIHADPILSGLGKYASKASVVQGSEGADLFQLQELADQLEEEQRRKASNE